MALSEPELPAASAVCADERRLTKLVAQHFALVWRVLRRFGVPLADIDDEVQRVFLVASRRLTEIPEAKEQGFLFQTAFRVAADARRTERRRREVSDDFLADQIHPLPSPEELVDQRRARALLDRILDGLPLDLRAVLVLYEMEQMSRSEIAAALDLPEGTVASRLKRARELFERRLAGTVREDQPARPSSGDAP